MGFQDAGSAVEAWGNERDYYDFGKPTGFTEETGHFTQLVWQATSSVGCGRVDCGLNYNHNHDKRDDDDDDDGEDAQGWYVVCEYWPPGNVIGDARFRRNVLSTDFTVSSNDESAGSALGETGRYGIWVAAGLSFSMAFL
jgi:hypothetical protein